MIKSSSRGTVYVIDRPLVGRALKSRTIVFARSITAFSITIRRRPVGAVAYVRGNLFSGVGAEKKNERSDITKLVEADLRRTPIADVAQHEFEKPEIGILVVNKTNR